MIVTTPVKNKPLPPSVGGNSVASWKEATQKATAPTTTRRQKTAVPKGQVMTIQTDIRYNAADRIDVEALAKDGKWKLIGAYFPPFNGKPSSVLYGKLKLSTKEYGLYGGFPQIRIINHTDKRDGKSDVVYGNSNIIPVNGKNAKVTVNNKTGTKTINFEDRPGKSNDFMNVSVKLTQVREKEFGITNPGRKPKSFGPNVILGRGAVVLPNLVIRGLQLNRNQSVDGQQDQLSSQLSQIHGQVLANIRSFQMINNETDQIGIADSTAIVNTVFNNLQHQVRNRAPVDFQVMFAGLSYAFNNWQGFFSTLAQNIAGPQDVMRINSFVSQNILNSSFFVNNDLIGNRGILIGILSSAHLLSDTARAGLEVAARNILYGLFAASGIPRPRNMLNPIVNLLEYLINPAFEVNGTNLQGAFDVFFNNRNLPMYERANDALTTLFNAGSSRAINGLNGADSQMINYYYRQLRG